MVLETVLPGEEKQLKTQNCCRRVLAVVWAAEQTKKSGYVCVKVYIYHSRCIYHHKKNAYIFPSSPTNNQNQSLSLPSELSPPPPPPKNLPLLPPLALSTPPPPSPQELPSEALLATFSFFRCAAASFPCMAPPPPPPAPCALKIPGSCFEESCSSTPSRSLLRSS